MVRVIHPNGRVSSGSMTHHDQKRGKGIGFVSDETKAHEAQLHDPHKPDFQKYKSASHSARDVVRDEVGALEPSDPKNYGR